MAPMPLVIAWPNVHVHGGARHGVRRLEELADQVQAVPHDVDRRLEIAEYIFVALLGDLRRGRDVDHEGNPALLGDLRDRRGGARVEGADQHIGAFLDQALGARARRVDVRLEVGVHQLDVDAQHLLDHAGREVGALLARLADEAEVARARQDDADLELLRLRADDAEWVQCSKRAGPGERLVELPSLHEVLLRGGLL
jgi:hypothetical protein